MKFPRIFPRKAKPVTPPRDSIAEPSRVMDLYVVRYTCAACYAHGYSVTTSPAHHPDGMRCQECGATMRQELRGEKTYPVFFDGGILRRQR